MGLFACFACAQPIQEKAPKSKISKADVDVVLKSRSKGVDDAASSQLTEEDCTACGLYNGAPFPLNEAERIDTLYRLGVLDTEQESRFDDITRLLCSIFNVPIAIVSLVDTQRQWFKSVMGLTCSQTDRQSSFCAWTLLPAHPEVLVVEDATKDARFKQNPLVKADPHIRFYAGAPLVSSLGYRLGSLCIIDRKPRSFDAESCNVLCNFAEIVVRQIEKTTMSLTQSYAIQQQANSLLRALNCFSEGLMLCQMKRTGWKVLYVNDAWTSITGISSGEAVNLDLWEVFKPASQERGIIDPSDAVRVQTDFQVTVTTAGNRSPPSNAHRNLLIAFRPAHLDPLDDNMPLIGIPGFVPWTNNISSNEEPYYFATVRIAEEAFCSDVQPFCEVEGQDAFPEVVLGPLLGKGSFGKVYRGIWKGVPVAVKVIQTELIDCGEGPDKPSAKLEAAVSSSIAHPNIVQTYKTATRECQQNTGKQNSYGGTALDATAPINSNGSGTPTGLWRSKDSDQELDRFSEMWILLEFCDMGTLADACEKGWFRMHRGLTEAPTCLSYVVCTAKEIASALRYLHSLDIVHADLTGGNVMLVSHARDPRGFTAKVTDFGMSRIVKTGVIRTETFGTATHMPPELLTKGICSKAVDVYAYGVLMWEMYNGKRAWGGMHQLQVIFNVTVQNRRLEFPPDAPPLFVSLAHKCMDPNPQNRPAFEEVIAELDTIEPLIK